MVRGLSTASCVTKLDSKVADAAANAIAQRSAKFTTGNTIAISSIVCR